MLPLTDPARDCLKQLDALRAEPADLAFVLETRGRLDAADVTIGIAGRIAEIRAELAEAADGALQPATPGERDQRAEAQAAMFPAGLSSCSWRWSWTATPAPGNLPASVPSGKLGA